MKNRIDFQVRGRYALFTDPLTRIGGEKCSYHLPTYEALKGIARSIFWKPTFIWVVDKVRIINRIRTESKSMKPIKYGGGNELAIYTYLVDVLYQVQVHFEWNPYRDDLAQDRIDGKHFQIAQRMVKKGGRQDIFLGTRECQGYVEPCTFGEGDSEYDNAGDVAYSLMFHGFDYPTETGKDELHTRFWKPVMKDGVIEFPRPEDCALRKFVRKMKAEPPETVGLKEVTLQDELD